MKANKKQKINIYKTILSSFESSISAKQQEKQFSFQSVKNISQIQTFPKNNRQDFIYSELNFFTPKKQSNIEKQFSTTNHFNHFEDKKIRINENNYMTTHIGQTNWAFSKKKSKIQQILDNQNQNQQVSFHKISSIAQNCKWVQNKSKMQCFFNQKEQTKDQIQIIAAIKKENQSNLPIIYYCLSQYSNLLSFIPIVQYKIHQLKDKQSLQNTSQSLQNLSKREENKQSDEKQIFLQLLFELDKNKQIYQAVLNKTKQQNKNILLFENNQKQLLNLLKQNFANSLIRFCHFIMDSQNYPDQTQIKLKLIRNNEQKQKQLQKNIYSIFLACKIIKDKSQNFSILNQSSVNTQLQFGQQVSNLKLQNKNIYNAVKKNINKKIADIQWFCLLKILFQAYKKFKFLSHRSN